MEYNATRSKLIIPEYGRNVQKMVEFAIQQEDREKRTRIAKTIISIMTQLNPQVRESNDYKQKLWDHLYIISDFRLEVDAPYPMPSPEILRVHPARVPYSVRNFRYGHYGRNIESIITRVSEMEEGPDKDGLVRMIANHLKKAFLTWNRDSVNDEVIYEHLDELSKGKLKLTEGTLLQQTHELIGRQNNKKKKFFPRQKDGIKKKKK